MDIKVGDIAPEFCLPDMDGNEVCLNGLKGRYAVVYFYPKDNTSGCTKEAKDFTEQLPRFEEISVPVIGISPDPPASHRKFADKHSLKITLLSDETHEVLERYNVWQRKSMYGREYWGVVRTTFIIDPEGKVVADWHKVKVNGHVDEVVARLKELV
jgi:peroxiredoxin Q/BCP